MKYFLYFSTDLEKLVEGFCLFFLNKNQKKQFLEPTFKFTNASEFWRYQKYKLYLRCLRHKIKESG